MTKQRLPGQVVKVYIYSRISIRKGSKLQKRSAQLRQGVGTHGEDRPSHRVQARLREPEAEEIPRMHRRQSTHLENTSGVPETEEGNFGESEEQFEDLVLGFFF